MTKHRRPLSALSTLSVCILPMAMPACPQGCRGGGEGETVNSSANTDSDTDDSDTDDSDTDGGVAEPAVCEALALARPMNQLCPPTRLVAPCDDPPDPCFTPVLVENSDIQPGQGIFQSYCVYKLEDDEACQEQFAGGLPAPLEQSPDVSRDCKVSFSAAPQVDPGASNMPSLVPPVFFQDWLTRHADIPGLPTSTGRVRVALIESANGSGTLDKHGRLMREIIERSPHDGANGDREVVDYPVLLDGGAFASEIALAIEDARQDWQRDNPDARFILNLSLAWERLEGLDPQDSQSPMVLHALQRASCDGALIIAAGGNESPYACPAGPVEPAKWTDLPRPDATTCSSFSAYEQNPVSAALPDCPDCPLVHAIGAIDELERDLPDFREGARVTLATRGDMARLGPEGPMSGTSVSAAVVSGVAARLWSHDNSQDPAELMSVLYASGHALAGPRGLPLMSELQLGSPREQRAIQPCLALLDLLGLDEPDPTRPDVQALTCPKRTFPAPALPLRVPTYTVLLDPQPLHDCPEADCTKVGPVARPEALAQVAPDPWGRPQPISYPCPPCKVKGFSDPALPNQDANQTSLELELDADAQNEPFTGVLVTLWDAKGYKESHFYSTTDLGKVDPQTGAVTPWTGEPIVVKDAGLFEVTGPDGAQRPPVDGWVEVRFNVGSEGNKLGGFTPSTSLGGSLASPSGN